MQLPCVQEQGTAFKAGCLTGAQLQLPFGPGQPCRQVAALGFEMLNLGMACV